jgi:uncharacterized Fe-S cluster-containing radical SAM superfamily protein
VIVIVKTNIILYGAGLYAQNNISRWLSEGLEPVCFADRNERKHGTQLFGYPVLSLGDAVRQYSDYELYLTLSPEHLNDATEYLIAQNIPKERIKYADKVTYRRGCPYIGTSFQISHHRVLICCDPSVVKDEYYQIPFQTLDDGIQNWENHCNELNQKIERQSECKCLHCNVLKHGYYLETPILREVVFASGFAGDLCNFRCIYCNTPQTMQMDTYGTPIDIEEALGFISAKYGKLPITIAFANGEITARRDCDDILRFCADRPWSYSFITNASIYRDSIADLCNRGRAVSMTVSLDAGTRRTYAKIKSADCFDDTLKNLTRYANAGVSVTLKYMIRVSKPMQAARNVV